MATVDLETLKAELKEAGWHVLGPTIDATPFIHAIGDDAYNQLIVRADGRWSANHMTSFKGVDILRRHLVPPAEEHSR